MSEQACLFCIDAPEADFDYCRVCGRGELTTEDLVQTISEVAKMAVESNPWERFPPMNQICVTCNPYPGDPCICTGYGA